MSDSSLDYWQTVAAIVEEAMELDGDDRDTFIHESVGGNYWVIYTHAARQALHYSDNGNAIFDAVGELEVRNWADVFTSGAFYAMLADVHDEITSLEF